MLKRAREVADIIQKSKEIHVVTHIDTDGITAGAIASQTLQRLGKEYSIECVKQLDEQVMQRLQDDNHELVWFTDLGSSISDTYPNIKKVTNGKNQALKFGILHIENWNLFGICFSVLKY